MKDAEHALAQRLISACEALLKNTSMKDAELVRGALDLAKAHYGTAGSGKWLALRLGCTLQIAQVRILSGGDGQAEVPLDL